MSTGLVPTASPGDEDLTRWAGTFLEVAKVATELAATPFVPHSLRVQTNGHYDAKSTAANVAAAVLTGRELGLEPMASLRSIDVVQGTPALRAIALRAILQRAGHSIWLIEATNTRAVVAGLRRGDDESHTQRAVWTMDDARQRNLAGKPNWRMQPRQMLVARATAEVARLVAADALLGVPYISEEIQDEPDTIGAPSTPDIPAQPPPPQQRRVRRRRAPTNEAKELKAVLDAPPPEDEPPLDESPPTGISPEQSKALHAGFRNLGISDRGQRMEIVASVLDREITSSSDLTRDEASTILAHLSALRARAEEEGPSEEEPEQ